MRRARRSYLNFSEESRTVKNLVRLRAVRRLRQLRRQARLSLGNASLWIGRPAFIRRI